MKKTEKNKFIRCDCYAHALCIQKDPDVQEAYFSYYAVMPYSESFWHRLQCAYAELKGDNWRDDLVFNKEQLIVIRDFLNEILEDWKE